MKRRPAIIFIAASIFFLFAASRLAGWPRAGGYEALAAKSEAGVVTGAVKAPSPAAPAAVSPAEENAGGAQNIQPVEGYRVYITSDVHFYPDSVHDNGERFARFEAEGDGKMLSKNVKITEAFINDILIEKPDAVILSGDLTLNGEKKGHEELAALLGKVVDAGVKVLVIPGNHDINNIYAREIINNKMQYAEYVSPEQFRDIYKRCGYGGAVSYDPDTLSYVAEMGDNLYAVMLDSCMYRSNIEEQTSRSSGTIYDETLQWLENTVTSIRKENKDAKFITAVHHNLFAHNSNFTFGYVIHSADATTRKLSELGINMAFSGHIHVQHILEGAVEGQKPITEVISSSLIVYPAAYGVAEFDASGMKYQTKAVDMARYAAQNGLADKDLYNFEEYSKEAFNERAAKRMAERLAESGYPQADIDEAVRLVKQLNAYYFAGRIDEAAEEIKSSTAYDLLMANSGSYVNSVIEEGKGEHNKAAVAWEKPGDAG